MSSQILHHAAQTAADLLSEQPAKWTNADTVNDRLKQVLDSVATQSPANASRLLNIQKSFFDQMAEDMLISGPFTDRLINDGVTFNDLKLASLTIVNWLAELRQGTS